MLIASLSFDVLPDKRSEFASAIVELVEAVRWKSGCLGCRLVSDCERHNQFTLMSEWDSRRYLDEHLSSREYQILEGTRFLLRDGPVLSIDEVIARARVPGRIRKPRAG
jgi:quinol monooxygenase YgiN